MSSGDADGYHGGRSSDEDDDDIEAPSSRFSSRQSSLVGHRSSRASRRQSSQNSSGEEDSCSKPRRRLSQGMTTKRLSTGSRQNSSDQLEIDDLGARISQDELCPPPTSTPAAPGANSKRLQVDDLGTRVTRVPSRTMSLREGTYGSAAASPSSFGVPRRSSLMTMKDRDAKIAATTPSQGPMRLSSIARMQLDDLEQKKLAANPPVSDVARFEHRKVSRKISVTELEQEKRIAASGMRVENADSLRNLQRNSLRRSIRPTPSRGASITSKDGKIVQGRSGRVIDLDAEFARLESRNNIVANHDEDAAPLLEEEYDADGNLIPALPGAIAVFGAEYDGDEDLEPDYVNPDNFDAARRAARIQTASNPPESPEEAPDRLPDILHPQEARAESIVRPKMPVADHPGQNTLFPGKEQKRKLCPLLIVLAVIIIAISVGVVIGIGANDGDDSPDITSSPTTSQPSSSPATLMPTGAPSSVAPSHSNVPSYIPSSAPSIGVWDVQGLFEGESFGTTVEMATDFLAFSNGFIIRSYELTALGWEQVGQEIDGENFRLSDTRRLVVRNGEIVTVYDLLDGIWIQVGLDIQGRAGAQSLSISKDGSTIAITTAISYIQQRSSFFRFDVRLGVGNWFPWGSDVIELSDFVGPASNALTSDGGIFTVGYDYQTGYTLAYTAPESAENPWISVLPSLLVFGGGPSVAISNDGVTVITGGLGRVITYNTTAPEPQVGTTYSLEGSRLTPLMALTGDGQRLAIAWGDNLNIVDSIGNGQYDSKGILPEIQFDIASISFSSDGKIAVGQPEGNMVQILEIIN